MVMEAAGAVASVAGDMLGFMKPTKAKLICHDSNLPDSYEPLEVMFNPNKYQLSTTVKIDREDNPNSPGGTAQYKGTGTIDLSMELFLDAFSELEGDVTPKVSTLLGWTYPTKSTAGTAGARPPRVGLEWGSNPQLTDFWGYLTKVDVSYTVFRMDGTPVRATVTLTISGQSAAMAGTNPTSHATDTRRARLLTDGDTLHSVAWRELGNATSWRAIAELNDIDDPQRVIAGSTVLIPDRASAAKAR
jgi:nucleoid-associated protein YgaU